MNAAVSGVKHEPSGADGPTLAGIDEIYVEKIGFDVRTFGEPRAAAIVGREDLTGCANRPTVIANQARRIESSPGSVSYKARLPVQAAVTRMNDRAARAHQTSMRFISKR